MQICNFMSKAVAAIQSEEHVLFIAIYCRHFLGVS